MKSIWIQDKQKQYPKLNKDIDCDVLIVGGGLSGILCAYQLQDKFEKIVLIESDEIASGATGRNTGKVTSQHGLNYQNILKYHEEEKTKLYYEENEQAISDLKDIVQKYQIDCDWKEKDNIVGCKSNYSLEKVKKEIEAYKICEIPYKQISDSQVMFTNQASFNPYAFTTQLAEKLKIEIYENTPLMKIKDHCVSTGMFEINYHHCIMATQVMPFQLKMFYAITQPKQTFLAALSPSDQRNEMILLEDEITKTKNDYDEFMLIGGYDHKLSEDSNFLWQSFKRDLVLEYPKNKVLYTWSSQDYECYDYLPIIDQFEDFISITGFNKWGNTNALVASKTVLDILTNQMTKRRELFSINRKSLLFNSKIITENIQTIKNLIQSKSNASKIQIPEDNQAVSIEINHHPYGIYRSNDILYIVDTVCPHLGCTLKFDEHECCWQCPCHGSLFSVTGEIMKGPALKNLNFSELKLK